ncbi:MAG: dihydrofolate reductase family protein [Notoacmeibacter sp.]
MNIFIAQTLDGFIAGPGDSLEHLEAFHTVETGYDAMVARAGSVVLGRRTFDRIFPTYGWTYPPHVQGCVVTHRPLPPATPASVVAMHDIDQIAALFPNAFIDGGADTIRQFLDAGHINHAEIFTLPVRIGAGVKLFPETTPRLETWTLLNVQKLDKGMIHARYEISAS